MSSATTARKPPTRSNTSPRHEHVAGPGEADGFDVATEIEVEHDLVSFDRHRPLRDFGEGEYAPADEIEAVQRGDAFRDPVGFRHAIAVDESNHRAAAGCDAGVARWAGTLDRGRHNQSGWCCLLHRRQAAGGVVVRHNDFKLIARPALRQQPRVAKPQPDRGRCNVE